MRRITTLFVFVAVLWPITSFADQPKQQLVWSELAVVRANPLGLNFDGTLDYQLRLYQSDSDLFATNYVSLAAKPIVTPAFTRLGARAQIMPLSILKLGVHYEFIQYFGSFDYLQSFEDPTAEWDPDTIEANGEADGNYVTSGTQLSFTGLLQAKVGPIAVRTDFMLARTDYALEGNDDVFYDPYPDIMLAAEGWHWTNDADLLYMNGPLIAGVRHSLVASSLPDIEPEDDPNGPVHRLGPLVLYKFWQNNGEGPNAFDSMRALALVQWYLTHRFRAGQWSSQAIPYMGFGVVFQGRFL
jgi:hypothetical protein